jgi:dimethylhistidine N-methyltransferase
VDVKTVVNPAISEAVDKGLSGSPKRLPSWLLYNDEGDRLFQQIMMMPEYYPTRCEYDILQHNKEELLQCFKEGSTSFRLIELGAGDGLKTEILLKHFVAQKASFTYNPVDISSNALDILSARLKSSLPQLNIVPLHKSYDDALSDLYDQNEKKVILFMGANIGNFTIQEAAQFLRKLVIRLHHGDQLMIGFDLKKDPRTILQAYDDPRGITAEFNLNLLRRLNRELGANFDTNHFSHYPSYDPDTGTTKSFLISLINQAVYIAALRKLFHFTAWEPIQTEVSQKYDITSIEKLMALTGLKVERVFRDARNYFCDVLVRAAS